MDFCITPVMKEMTTLLESTSSKKILPLFLNNITFKTTQVSESLNIDARDNHDGGSQDMINTMRKVFLSSSTDTEDGMISMIQQYMPSDILPSLEERKKLCSEKALKFCKRINIWSKTNAPSVLMTILRKKVAKSMPDAAEITDLSLVRYVLTERSNYARTMESITTSSIARIYPSGDEATGNHHRHVLNWGKKDPFYSEGFMLKLQKDFRESVDRYLSEVSSS